MSCSNDHTVQFWNLRDKKLIHSFDLGDSVWGCAVNGSFIVAAVVNGTVRVFDYSGKVLFSEQFAEGSK